MCLTSWCQQHAAQQGRRQLHSPWTVLIPLPCAQPADLHTAQQAQNRCVQLAAMPLTWMVGALGAAGEPAALDKAPPEDTTSSIV